MSNKECTSEPILCINVSFTIDANYKYNATTFTRMLVVNLLHVYDVTFTSYTSGRLRVVPARKRSVRYRYLYHSVFLTCPQVEYETWSMLGGGPKPVTQVQVWGAPQVMTPWATPTVQVKRETPGQGQLAINKYMISILSPPGQFPVTGPQDQVEGPFPTLPQRLHFRKFKRNNCKKMQTKSMYSEPILCIHLSI